MKNFDFEQLFDNITQSFGSFGDRIYSAHEHRTSAVAKKRKRSRTCRIEELESREMLSVNVLDAPVADFNGEQIQTANFPDTSADNPDDNPIVVFMSQTHDLEKLNAISDANPDVFGENYDWLNSERAVWENERLVELRVSDLGLTDTLDLAGCDALRVLEALSNQLTGLNVSGCTALEILSVDHNQLTALDVTQNTALRNLACWNNQLTVLDISNNTALRELWCADNQLTELNVTNNTLLAHLSFWNNRLTVLDVSNNIALRDLQCVGNQLTELDVSNNTALTNLQCQNNQLTVLDVSNNTALTNLQCQNNQLTVLDVSNNTALTELLCQNNQLTFSSLFLPDQPLDTFTCSPQQGTVPITLGTNNTVDLFNENIGGNTDYIWYRADGTVVDSSLYAETNGVFVFTGLPAGTVVYCEMTNVLYPDLTLLTTEVTLNDSTAVTLDAPTLNQPTVVNGTTLRLTWTPIENASGYTIYYAVNPSAPSDFQSRSVPGDGDIGTFDLDDLTPDTTYTITIAARGDGMDYLDSPPSPNLVQGTPTDHVANRLPTPTLFSLTVVNASTITASWNRITDASSYLLEYATNANFTQGLGTQTVGQLTIPTVTANITGLSGETTYYVRVIAVGSGDFANSLPSNVAEVTLPAPDPAKIAKAKSNSRAATINSVTLTWTANERNTEFEIVCASPNITLVDSQIRYIYTESGLITGAVISGLEAGKRYKFSVVAKNSSGSSTYQQGSKMKSTAVKVSAKTQKYNAPKGLKEDKTQTTLRSVTVNWSPSGAALPTDVPESYIVEIWNAPRRVEIHEAVITLTGMSATISGLAPGTKYTVVVKAESAEGTVSLENRIRVSTARYTAVNGFTATAGADFASLSWEPSPFAETNGYEVFRLVGRTEIPAAVVFTSDTNATVLDLEPGERHKFVVRAVVKDMLGVVLYRSAPASVSVRLG